MPIFCSWVPALYPIHGKKGQHNDVTGIYQRKQGSKKKGK